MHTVDYNDALQLVDSGRLPLFMPTVDDEGSQVLRTFVITHYSEQAANNLLHGDDQTKARCLVEWIKEARKSLGATEVPGPEHYAPRCACRTRELNQPCPLHGFTDEGLS